MRWAGTDDADDDAVGGLGNNVSLTYMDIKPFQAFGVAYASDTANAAIYEFSLDVDDTSLAKVAAESLPHGVCMPHWAHHPSFSPTPAPSYAPGDQPAPTPVRTRVPTGART